MYCSKCGKLVDDNLNYCPNCGENLTKRVNEVKESCENNSQRKFPPENYLVWAILSTVFCCLPFGIVSIVNAANVESKFNRGDYDGALDASKKAKKWAWISAISGFVFWFLYVILIFVGFFAELMFLDELYY